jgi:hypothetical protein
MRTIDADGHVQEPSEAIARLLPPHLRDRAPHSAIDAAGRIRQVVGGEGMPYIPVPAFGRWDVPEGGENPARERAALLRTAGLSQT